MMKDIKQDQMGNGVVGKWQIVTVADEIEPRIRKQVRANRRGKMLLEVADAGADLDDQPRNIPIQLGNNAAIKIRVNILKERLVAPAPQVRLNLGLVLGQWNHEKNFKRRAANQTMRRS